MKLYFKPGACSLASHIVAREAGLPIDLVKVDLMAKTLEDGSNFLDVNTKGQVPALVLDDGALLTEGAVIMQYLADKAPATALVPAAGTMDRYRVLEWVNFVGTELHKTYAPLFRPTTPDAYKEISRANLAAKYAVVEKRLAETPFLAGDTFTIADAYAFTTMTWAGYVGLDLEPFPAIRSYFARIKERPAVQETLKAEGLN